MSTRSTKSEAPGKFDYMGFVYRVVNCFTEAFAARILNVALDFGDGFSIDFKLKGLPGSFNDSTPTSPVVTERAQEGERPYVSMALNGDDEVDKLPISEDHAVAKAEAKSHTDTSANSSPSLGSNDEILSPPRPPPKIPFNVPDPTVPTELASAGTTPLDLPLTNSPASTLSNVAPASISEASRATNASTAAAHPMRGTRGSIASVVLPPVPSNTPEAVSGQAASPGLTPRDDRVYFPLAVEAKIHDAEVGMLETVEEAESSVQEWHGAGAGEKTEATLVDESTPVPPVEAAFVEATEMETASTLPPGEQQKTNTASPIAEAPYSLTLPSVINNALSSSPKITSLSTKAPEARTLYPPPLKTRAKLVPSSLAEIRAFIDEHKAIKKPPADLNKPVPLIPASKQQEIKIDLLPPPSTNKSIAGPKTRKRRSFGGELKKVKSFLQEAKEAVSPHGSSQESLGRIPRNNAMGFYSSLKPPAPEKDSKLTTGVSKSRSGPLIEDSIRGISAWNSLLPRARSISFISFISNFSSIARRARHCSHYDRSRELPPV